MDLAAPSAILRWLIPEGGPNEGPLVSVVSTSDVHSVGWCAGSCNAPATGSLHRGLERFRLRPSLGGSPARPRLWGAGPVRLPVRPERVLGGGPHRPPGSTRAGSAGGVRVAGSSGPLGGAAYANWRRPNPG